MKIIIIALSILLANSAWSMPEIHFHAKDGRLSEVKALLKKDPTLLDLKAKYGKTPLLWATITGREQVIDYLIKQGAAIAATDNFGSGALHLAVESDNPKLVEKFVKMGLDINLKNKHGDAPLHDGSRAATPETIKVLLKANAIVNQENKGGYTPMDKAFQSRKLVENKDDSHSKIQLKKYNEVILLLKKAGGITKKKR